MSEQHPDDRKALAYAYNGLALVAVGYRREIVQHWESATNYSVCYTPLGEEVVVDE